MTDTKHNTPENLNLANPMIAAAASETSLRSDKLVIKFFERWKKFHLHKWERLSVTKGQYLRQVTDCRHCLVCGKHQIKKTWHRRWMDTAFNTKTKNYDI